MSSSRAAPQVPSIVETPPFDQDEPQVAHPTRAYPQRSSSQNTNAQMLGQPATEEPPPKSSKRSVTRPLNTPQSIKQPPREQHSEQQSAASASQQPAGLPGSDAGRTDSMIVIPTFSSPEDKKEKKSRKHKDDDADSPSPAKSGWKWFKSGSDAKEKKKQQQQQQQQQQQDEERKSKARSQGDKTQDNARLDVIDNAIGRGRESFAMDRDGMDGKLHEERKKESHKKTESKKEKDGLFASIFGVSKKKEKDSGKKHHARALSPEPSYRDLVPDRDYNWTRFPLIKERAIYRLAHMKLANPRRSLHSQVLLSNFMYSYLAKVQAMHPQMQVPQSPQQKRLEEERRRKEQEEQYLLEQQMHQEAVEQGGIDQYNFEYHRNANQYGDNPIEEQDGEYDDGGQYYDEDGDRNGGRHPHDSGYGDGYLHPGSRDYYAYDDDDDQQLHQSRGERW